MIYVDNMEAEFNPSHWPGRKYILSHMIADTNDELHRMADRIGVARRWFQDDHYDITKSKRLLAVKLGAVEITWRQAAAMMFLRRRGLRMGFPEDAYDRAMRFRRQNRG